MNRMESLMVAYPMLSYEFESMPKRLGGLVEGEEVTINSNRSIEKQTEALAEEIAHYETSTGNILNLKDIKNSKQEYQARRRSCFLLLDLDSLTACSDVGIDTPQELADYFEVSIEFLWKTIENYRTKYGLEFDHKGYHFNLRTGLNIKKK
ncbi:hypothetical protein RD055328_08770 [Companilactobacillus sp. RD055328]|nr:hypothetical protein RD055328_08770 [Companilactobacillus sp. RD055328]